MSLDSNETSKLLDELSSSILQTASASKRYNEKRLQDTFRRRVKRHNNARTNQFEVIERLDGLEEKFQILTLDNLSDALHQRRGELKEYEHQWLPDVLHFFLHLAGDPARNENLLRMYRVPPRIGTPPPLRWKDVLADDPIDRNDRLWRVPNFRDTDDSGYDDDDDDMTTSTKTSPSNKREKSSSTDLEVDQDNILLPPQEISSTVLAAWRSHVTDWISEIAFIREMLFVLRGFPSQIFQKEGRQYQLSNSVLVSGISSGVLRLVVAQIAEMRQQVEIVQSWTAVQFEVNYIEAMQDAISSELNLYNSQLDEMQQNLLALKPLTTASVIRIMHETRSIGTSIFTIAEFLKQGDQREVISYLDTLFSVVQLKHACNEYDPYRLLLKILVPSLNTYLGPCWRWLQSGELEEKPFFVRSEIGAADSSRLWHDRYMLVREGPSRPARFISGIAARVLACGKTASFIRQLSSSDDFYSKTVRADFLTPEIIQSALTEDVLPFIDTFQNAFFEDVDGLLERHTRELKSILNSRCGVHLTLDAIDQIFLGQNTVILGEIEPKIFDRIDRCLDGWNDRFEVRDMLETAFTTNGSQYTVDSISIHSTFTSSRTMQSRRSSVKILGALSFRYRLSWPLANIIDENSLSIYRSVALALMQIRRARYSLQRNGYLSVMAYPIDSEAIPRDQDFAQTLAFQLISFVNALYDCMTITIMQPLSQNMRREIEEALTIDDMIHVHKEYVKRLESTCLVGSKLKILRQSLITILDLCIRFSDLVTNSAKNTNGDSDAEAGSFTSALSRRRRAQSDNIGSDVQSDEDGLVDGYSSFIVLEDNTSIVKELRKLKTQYQRQLKFFIAGLKGVGKAGQHVQDLATLADRLSLSEHE